MRTLISYQSYTHMPKLREKLGRPPDPDANLRALTTELIRHCPKSRAEIADEMSALLEQRVTVSMLNDYTSDAKKAARFPACFVRALCEATGDESLLDSLETAQRLRHLELGRAL